MLPISPPAGYQYHWVQIGTSYGIWLGNPTPPPAPAPVATPAAVATSTGVNPVETSYSLYGHIIPLSVFGVGRIGGEIIAGPWVSSGLASFIISFGVPADPAGTRDIREIAFDSEVVWSTNGASGVTTSAGGTFTTESFTFNFKGGTLTQTVTSLETIHSGSEANAYRPQIIIEFINLPLSGTKFGKIPYVSAVIGDSSGDDVNYGEAFERLANSPWAWGSVEGPNKFETSGITDGVTGGGLIIAQQSEFLQLIQQFGRFYPKWDILQTDKLRIVDRGDDVSADINLDKSRLVGQVTVARAEPNSAPSVLELSTIDPDADYTIVPYRADTPRAPVAVTSSVRTDEAYLPVIMDSSTRASVATYTKYHEEQARKKVTFTAMAIGLEIEPGSLVGIGSLGEDFTGETFRVIETLHGINYTVECTAEAILRCGFSTDPHLGNVVLLLGFEDVNGAVGAPGFTDESPAAHGTAFLTDPGTNTFISTDQFRYGRSSVRCLNRGPLFSGSTDWVLSSANSDQFTVEFSVYFNTLPFQVLIANWHALASGLVWSVQTNGGTEIDFCLSTDGVTFDVVVSTTGAGLATGLWMTIAVDKDSSGKIRVYKNGVMLGSSTPANSAMFNSPTALTLGMTEFIGGLADCWMDEVRITKGVARYASDGGYTVSSSAFPRE